MPPLQCDTCQKTHPRGCRAHRSTDGEPCGNHPTPGADVCRYHGGRARQVREKAAERLDRAETERQVARTLGELGVSIPTSDGEALLEQRDKYRGIVKALWFLASDLSLIPSESLEGTGTDGIYGHTYHQTGKPTGEAKPHVVMVMLADWSDRLAKIDEACVRLGLEARRVRAEEAELVLLAQAVDVMLAQVVPPELHAQARLVLAGELRRLDNPKGDRR